MQYDQLQVAGDVELAGALAVSFLPAFKAAVGDSLPIVEADSITGEFELVLVNGVPDGLDYQLQYNQQDVSIVLVAGGLVGDVNGDGVVDLLDVAPFVDLILGGGFDPNADVNGDGVVDLLDVAPFVDLIGG